MHKIVISGGPSTGKSTTFEMLREAYPEAYFVPEAAEQVIERELAMQKADPLYEPRMPTVDYRKFAPLVLAQQLEDEAMIPDDAELVLMDRCIIDNLGYLAVSGLTDLIPMNERHIADSNYTMVFFCDWLDKFEQTEIRRETPEEGLAIHQQLETAYRASGIPMVYLPNVDPQQRLAIIQTTIARL